MNARFFLVGADLEARFFLAGDVEAGPDEAGLLDDSPPPLSLQPLPCHCSDSVAEVEGGATLIEGGGTAILMSRPMWARNEQAVPCLCSCDEVWLQGKASGRNSSRISSFSWMLCT